MPFWTDTKLADMTEAQWESLCDNCGKCCLIRLEDEDTGDIHTTDVHCKLFDSGSCRCSNYVARKAHVPDCVKLTPEKLGELTWLPMTCAYRLVQEGQPLFDWHPLVSGDSDSVHKAGMSVRNQTVPECKVKVRHLVRRIKIWPGEENA
ncbi:MAG: hypothetical protein CFE32_16750 [Alphaproteobacteria bacterium PA3]|nr:MAG: hypothetical protein CFE32_16750 [Alphaproteobacteria bacterium PA3]